MQSLEDLKAKYGLAGEAVSPATGRSRRPPFDPVARVRERAPAYEIDPEFALKVMGQESGGSHYGGGGVLTSNKGARGLFQVLPETGRRYGFDVNDPEQNIEAGLSYLADAKKRFNGDRALMLAGYHSGLDDAEAAWRNPAGNPKTHHYVRSILGDEEYDAAFRGGAAGPGGGVIERLRAKYSDPSFEVPQAAEQAAPPAARNDVASLVEDLSAGKHLKPGEAAATTTTTPPYRRPPPAPVSITLSGIDPNNLPGVDELRRRVLTSPDIGFDEEGAKSQPFEFRVPEEGIYERLTPEGKLSIDIPGEEFEYLRKQAHPEPQMTPAQRLIDVMQHPDKYPNYTTPEGEAWRRMFEPGGRFFGAIGRAIAGMAEGVAGDLLYEMPLDKQAENYEAIRAGKQPPHSRPSMVGSTIDAQAGEFQKAYEVYSRHRGDDDTAFADPEFWQHSIAGAIPFLGPQASEAVEQVKRGEGPEAAATVAMIVLPIAHGVIGKAKAGMPIREAVRTTVEEVGAQSDAPPAERGVTPAQAAQDRAMYSEADRSLLQQADEMGVPPKDPGAARGTGEPLPGLYDMGTMLPDVGKLQEMGIRGSKNREVPPGEAGGAIEQIKAKYEQGSAAEEAPAPGHHSHLQPRTAEGRFDGPPEYTESRPVQAPAPEAGPKKYDYSSTQVDLPDEVAASIREFGSKIPDDLLAGGGRESEPHVTVKYGLHGEDAAEVAKVLEGEPPIKVRFGKTSLFENPEGDVLKVDVGSPDLHRLNAKIKGALPNTESHPDYKPHATVAYLKSGEGKKYAGNDFLEGKETTIDRITFSSKSGEQVEIPLKGKAAADKTGRKEQSGSTFVRGEKGEKPAELQGAEAPLSQTANNISKGGTKPASIDPAKYVNFEKLDISNAEKENLGKLIQQSVAESPDPKARVTFDEIREQARNLDLELLKDLKPPKEGETLHPAVMHAARERINSLNREAMNVQREIEQGRNTLTREQLDALEKKRLLLEHDARQLLDVVIPTRSQNGRNLAYMRMVADATGFDVEQWISRARRVGERAGENTQGRAWQEKESKIREILANGQDAEAKAKAIDAQVADLRKAYKHEISAIESALKEAKEQGVPVSSEKFIKEARRRAAESYKAKLTEAELAARERLKGFFNPNVVHDVTDIGRAVADLAIVGAAKLARRGIDRAVWAREMIDEFGEAVRPHIRAVFHKSYHLYREEVQASRRAAQELRLTGGRPEDFTTGEISALVERANKERARMMQARRELARTFMRLEQTHWATTVSAFGKAGLLGSLKMITRDVAGTGGQQVISAIERVPASFVDMVVGAFTKRRAVTGANPRAVARSVAEIVRKAPKETSQILREGATREQVEKMQLPGELNSRSRVVNAYVNGVMRVRTAADNAHMIYATRRNLEDLARAQALTEAKAGTITRSEVGARTRELVANPPEDLALRAVAEADYITYHLDNPLSAGLRAMKGRMGPVGTMLVELPMPFDRATTNITRMIFFDYTPLSPVYEASRAAIRAATKKGFSLEDQRRLSQSFGRAATGTVALAAVGYTLGRMGYLTGFSPEKYSERETEKATGRPPMSVYNPLAGTWHSIGWLGPWGVTLAVGAEWAETEDEEGAAGKMVKSLAGETSPLGQIPLLKGTKQAQEMIGAVGSDKFGEKAGRMLNRFVPSMVADAAEAIDPYERDAPGFVEQFKSRIPVARESLPARTDALGKPVESPLTDMIDPTRTRKDRTDDPLVSEIARLKVGLSKAKKEPGEKDEEFRERAAKHAAAEEARLRSVVEAERYKEPPAGIEADRYRKAALEIAKEAASEDARTGRKVKSGDAARIMYNARVVVERDNILRAFQGSEEYRHLTREQKNLFDQSVSAEFGQARAPIGKADVDVGKLVDKLAGLKSSRGEVKRRALMNAKGLPAESARRR